MHITFPHRPGMNHARASHEAAERFEDQSGLRAAAGALEIASAALEIQLKDMRDDAGVRLVEGALQEIEEAASKMRFRAEEM